MQDITVGSRVRIINDDGIAFACVGKITRVVEIRYSALDHCYWYYCGTRGGVLIAFARAQLELV